MMLMAALVNRQWQEPLKQTSSSQKLGHGPQLSLKSEAGLDDAEAERVFGFLAAWPC